MIVYEVNVSVSRSIAQDFMAWLPSHVEQVLASEGFLRAQILRDTEQDEAERLKLTIIYEIATRAAYERYLQRHAAALREDGLRRFGGSFTATRRVFQVEQTIVAKA